MRMAVASKGIGSDKAMWSLIEEFFGYILDVLFVRRARNQRGLPENSIAQDAKNVASFHIWAFKIGLAAGLAILTLIFVFDWPVLGTFALIAIPCGIYGGIKFSRLMRH